MRIISIIVIVAAIISGTLVFAETKTSEVSGDLLAQVGNYNVTREMVDNIIATIPEENRVPFLTPDGRKKILDEIVSFILFAEAAKADGMDKDPAIMTRLDYTKTEYLAKEYFRRKTANNPTSSEEELMSYYKSHLSEFKPPEEIKARHILVKTEAEANKILDELKKGADFSELAKKYSIDPAAAKGGKLELMDGRDWLPRGTFEKSFEHVLFKISPGQVGGPVKTQFGWHLVKVDEKREPETPSFAQVRSFIRNRLQEDKNAQLHKQLTEEIKKKIPVVVK